MKRIIVCAGGTGGHVFPALELCDQLNAEDYDCILLTDLRGRRFCDKTQVKCQVIPEISSSIKSLARSIINAVRIVVALGMSWKKDRPSAVIGFGGVMTILPLLIARMMKIPYIIHEQNSIPGRANRLLARLGAVATSNFEIKGYNKVATPVRREIQAVAASVYEPIRNGRFVLTIIGGSQGAAIFTRIVPLAIEMLPVKIRKILTIVQQTDFETVETLTKIYNELEVKNRVVNFIHDMDNVLVNSSLVICRSGASTINELATIGRPAIFIPYPYAADNHQKRNAEIIEDLGGGWVINEASLSPKIIASKIEDLIYSKDQLSLSAVNMLRSRSISANTELKKIIINGGTSEIVSN